jgi:aspartate-semialdehyde dehydrogenase
MPVMAGYHVAVVGATGAVGQEMLAILQERKFPVKSLRLLASKRSVGKSFPFKGESIEVQELKRNSFRGIDIALFSAGADRSKQFAPAAVKAGAVVIDNSSAFRMEKTVPLVVPEINAQDIQNHKGIIANPNCTTIVTLMGLYPLRPYGIRRVILSSYQAVSGAGAWAIEELRRQTLEWALQEIKNATMGTEETAVLRPEKFPHQIAFNLIPHIDRFLEGGYTKEEAKCLLESRKILAQPNLQVSATTVRVPVFRSHSVSVHLETERPLSVPKARSLIRKAKGVKLYDQPEKSKYPTPIQVAGKDDCLVGRIRKDETVPNGLCLWIVGDQLRKGAALNAIQIAESLLGVTPKGKG